MTRRRYPRPDAPVMRQVNTLPRVAKEWSNAPITTSAQRQVKSRDDLEVPNRDLTCQVNPDRTRHCVSFSPRLQSRPRQRSSARPNAPLASQVTSCSNIQSHGKQRPRAPPHFINDRTNRSCVRSRQLHRLVTVGQWKTTSPLHQLRHPYSNVTTTKCITLCTCVSIFSPTFSRVLALH
jgi:hypothetical protein